MGRFPVVGVTIAAWLAPLALPAGAGPRAANSPYVVSLRADAGDPDTFAAQAGQRLGFSARHVYHTTLRGFAARLTAAGRAALSSDPRVESVEPDWPLTGAGQVIPNGIRRVHADPDTNANSASKRTTGSVNVAVLDSGIDRRHPDLNVVGGVNCSGGTGYDDVYGHGTHIAGIIGALNNRIGVVGVAPGVRLWGVKVLDDEGNGTVSDLLCGVDWVTSTRQDRDAGNDIAVANLSVGGRGADDGHCGYVDADLLHRAICRSVEQGVTYVAAAGNDHTDASTVIPAAYREVITVSALADSDGQPGGIGGAPWCRDNERDDTLASFSNYGPAIDLIAPGVCILSTMPIHYGHHGEHGGYGTLTGTSFAAPHVSGAAAVWLSRHPNATPAEVRNALISAGSSDWDNRDDPDGIKEPLVNLTF